MPIDPITAVSEIGSKLIDRLWPDPSQRDAAKLELFKLQQSGELTQLAHEIELMKAQTEVNKAEAINTNLFVSGWRPSVGWICSSGLLIQFIINPFCTWIAALTGNPISFPSLDMGSITMLLTGMLGIAGMRTYEKINKVS
jgi:hypothetical protein